MSAAVDYERPTLGAMLLEVALVVAQRSTCSRLQVGAVLAREGRILSTGYNGAPAGEDHCRLHVEGESCPRAVHAEANALIFAGRHGVPTEGAHLYVTHSPCAPCAGLMLNAGITGVTYLHPYRSRAGLQRLERAGIRASQVAL